MSDKLACVNCTKGNYCKLACPDCKKHNSTYPVMGGRMCSTCQLIWRPEED